MQDLLNRFKELNFNPPDVQLDGAVHRFDRDGVGNAWYIGWRNIGMRSGKPFVVAQFGDWKTRELHTYHPTKDISAEDKAAIKIQMQAASNAAKAQKSERQNEASAKADSSWARAVEIFESPYYARKLIDQAYGTKTYLDGDNNRVILVPMRDVEGVLWGIQRIWPDGKKRFMMGQKVEGCFHMIGGAVTGEVLVCEGFATGVSLHLATGIPTAVAFNAGNLVDTAKALRKKYPDVAMTICGDDDRWTDENPGRTKATKAGVVAQAGTVFPEFSSLDDRPTDFNDLHVREGLGMVKRHFMEPVNPETGFMPLGYEEDTHFFYSIESKDVVKVRGYTEIQMYHLAPESYWAEHYPSKSGTRWSTAKNDLVQKSRAVGPFDNSRIRGTGVWMDDSRVVVNTGHGLMVDGKPMPMTAIRSWRVYVQTKNRMPPMHEKPLTVEEAGRLVDACQAFAWRDEEKAGILLAGWLAIARIAAALPIRPHVWLTGGSGTGKSTIMERIVAPALGSPKGKIYLQGGSTEAGIRQEVKSSSLPVIFDEFETNNDQNRERVQNLVELLRQSWSSTQGVVVKGSASGLAVQYQLSFPALVSSIRINLDNDADRSRFSVLELAPHDSRPDSWKRIQGAISAIDVEFGERLFARSCAMVRIIVQSQARLVNALAAVMGQRFAQQTGTILAGYWSLISDDVISHESAAALVQGLNLVEEKQDVAQTDEVDCLNHLMTWKVTVRDSLGNTMDGTIGQLASRGNRMEEDALKTYGVIVESDGIFIANDHAELSRIFARTRWATDYKRILLRIPGAKRADRKWFGKKQSRAVMIPRSAV